MAKGKTTVPAKKKATPKANDGTKDLAFRLYMDKIPQGEIAERCDVSQQTISTWKKDGEWETKRAAKNISVASLVAKTLQKADKLLDEENFNADAFSKAIAQLKTLKVRNTVDDEIMCFLDFQNYLMERRVQDGIDEGFIKTLVKLQDSFIKHRMGNV